MFNILNFGSNQASKSKEFGLEDLSNDTFEISKSGIAILRTVPDGDWSNQELASIYFAVRLFQGSGVATETDRGITDDGNPWFVFCNSNGDVLVHIARIDFAYVLDGVGLDSPLAGKTFDELINRFVSGATNKVISERKEGLSATLDLLKHRHNKVFVHPAAQLVALIWAAMIVNDAAATNTAEADWRTFQDEPDMQRVGVLDFGIPKSGHPLRHHLPEAIEHNYSDFVARLRDVPISGIQSAGLLSLGYFLVGTKHMLQSDMPDWLYLDPEVQLEEDAAAGSTTGVPGIFLDMVKLLSALFPVMQENKTHASQVSSGFNADHVVGVEHTYPFALLPGPPEEMLEMGLSVDWLIDVFVPKAFLQEPQVNLEAQEEALEITASPAVTNELEEPYTIDDLFSYLANFELNSLQGNETFVEDLIILEQSTQDAQFSKDGQVPSQDALIETGTVTSDADVIAAIIEFLSVTEDILNLYYDEGVHIIEHQGVQIEGVSDPLALSWTFADGSQIIIVGTATDLLPLDLLF